MKGLQDKLASCEQQLEACIRCEVEARTALDHAEREMTQLRQDYEAELQQSDSRAKELDRVAQELQSTKPKLQRMMRNEKKMLAHIELQDASIQTLDEAHASMKDSLETLFADMVSLAKLYESKEKEEHKSREQEESTIEDLTRQLRAERARYAQLEETYRQTEVNNNMLSSKYEKVRKLLEQEREERNNESARFAAEQRKRFVPASYMSHLHTSSASMRSDSLKRDRMRLVLSNEGKENDMSTSSSSRVSHKSSSR
jgi:chromosome segregation ATPase